ncbi:MAG: DUF1934 domain-containing protein [Ruminococcaceae bacterium]|nr:DUF1934 domain-containing protein [Oscillospiraceae bacterium]
MLKKVKLKIKSEIENLNENGTPDGDTELSESAHSGAMKISGSEFSLSYREMTESGSVFSDILIRESGTVTVRRSGAIDSTMHFDINEEFNTVYSLPPYKFDMTVRTEKIKNSLSVFGGTLEIFYGMSVGGADKRVKMRIEVSEV